MSNDTQNAHATQGQPEQRADQTQTQGNAPEVFRQNDQQSQAPNNRDRPGDVLRDGALKAVIWRNQGAQGDYYTTRLSKTYTDRNGNFQDGQSFSKSDLPKLGILATKAYERIGDMQREHTQSHAQDQGQAQHPNGQQQAQAQNQSAAQDARAPQGFAESRTTQAPAQSPSRGR